MEITILKLIYCVVGIFYFSYFFWQRRNVVIQMNFHRGIMLLKWKFVAFIYLGRNCWLYLQKPANIGQNSAKLLTTIQTTDNSSSSKQQMVACVWVCAHREAVSHTHSYPQCICSGFEMANKYYIHKWSAVK